MITALKKKELGGVGHKKEHHKAFLGWRNKFFFIYSVYTNPRSPRSSRLKSESYETTMAEWHTVPKPGQNIHFLKSPFFCLVYSFLKILLSKIDN